jgi:hypothetical protein
MSENIYQDIEMEEIFAQCHQETSDCKVSIPLHSHDFYEILYVCNGSPQYLLDSSRYQLAPGDIVFLPAGVPHCPIELNKLIEPYRRYVLWVKRSFLETLIHTWPELEVLKNKKYILHTNGDCLEKLHNSFKNLSNENRFQLFCWEAALALETGLLLIDIQRVAMNISEPKPEEPRLLDQILNYIDLNLNNKLDLEQISHKSYVSSRTVSRLFRLQLNVSCSQFITQKRLIVAKNLISAGKPLEQIYNLVGFGDYSSFYRAFKREYGISPSQYRKLGERLP